MTRIVYSTDKGKVCPRCGHPQVACCCTREETTPAGDGVVRVRRERKGRKGKTVTVVTGIPLAATELRKLGADLKRTCGAGGSVQDGILQIQGDKVERLVTELEKRGFTVKVAG